MKVLLCAMVSFFLCTNASAQEISVNAVNCVAVKLSNSSTIYFRDNVGELPPHLELQSVKDTIYLDKCNKAGFFLKLSDPETMKESVQRLELSNAMLEYQAQFLEQ